MSFQSWDSSGVNRAPAMAYQVSGETEYRAAELGENTFEVLSEVADQDTLHEIFDPVMEKVAQAQKAIYEKSK